MPKIINFVIAAFFLIAGLFIINTSISDKFSLHTTGRIIYIPVYFWATLAFFLSVQNRLLKESKNLKTFIIECIVVGLPVHLYLLLGNLIVQLSDDPQLSRIFLYYIWMIVFLFSLFFALIGRSADKKETKLNLLSSRNCIIFILSPIALSLCLLFQSNVRETFVVLSGFITGFFLARKVNLSSITIIFKNFYENEKQLAFTVFLLSFLIRYASSVNIILKTGYDPLNGNSFPLASDDGYTYDDIGMQVMNNYSMIFNCGVELWGHFDRAYGVFLGTIYAIFGRNFYVATFFQSIIGSLIPMFLFYIGKRLISKRVGIIAAIFTAFNEPLIWHSGVYGHEALWCPVLVIFSFTLVKINQSNEKRVDWGMLIISGLLLGILALFRSIYLYYFVLVGAWFLIFRKINFLKRVVSTCIVISIAFSFILMTFSITHNTLGGNKNKAELNWRVNARAAIPPFLNIANERFIDMGINPFIGDLKNGVVKPIIEQPIKFLITSLEVIPLRIIAYFEAYQFGNFDPLYMVNSAKIAARFPSNLEFYTSILFMIGVCMVVRNKRLLCSPFFMPLAFNIFCYAIVFGHHSDPRLREVSIPYIYMVGAIGIDYLLYFLDTKKDVEKQ